MEFLWYNRELYALLEEKLSESASGSTNNLGLGLSAEKRKVIDDDDMGMETPPGLADGDSDVPQSGRKRTKRNRTSVSYIEPAPSYSDSDDGTAQQPRFKEELIDSDNDLYSAPNPPPRAQQIPVQRHSSRPASGTSRESCIEIYEKENSPWVRSTEDNDRIAASDDWAKKFDANELIKVWSKLYIPNLPWPTIKFTRRFLSKVIGGGEQMVECVISEGM